MDGCLIHTHAPAHTHTHTHTCARGAPTCIYRGTYLGIPIHTHTYIYIYIHIYYTRTLLLNPRIAPPPLAHAFRHVKTYPLPCDSPCESP